LENRYYALYLRVAMGRKRLEELATRYGQGDPRVLAYSRKLDRLIVELQRRRMAG